MKPEEIDEAIDVLVRACAIENRRKVQQALRKMVANGGDIVPEESNPVVQVSIRDGFIIGGINGVRGKALPDGKHQLCACVNI